MTSPAIRDPLSQAGIGAPWEVGSSPGPHEAVYCCPGGWLDHVFIPEHTALPGPGASAPAHAIERSVFRSVPGSPGPCDRSGCTTGWYILSCTLPKGV